MVSFRLALVVLFISSATVALAQEPEPFLTSSTLPVYPPIASTAHISGTVRISFTISPAGDVVECKTISGHPMLAQSSLNVVRSWKFGIEDYLPKINRTFETEFVYRLTKRQSNAPVLTVSMASFRRISITKDRHTPTVNY